VKRNFGKRVMERDSGQARSKKIGKNRVERKKRGKLESAGMNRFRKKYTPREKAESKKAEEATGKRLAASDQLR